MSRAGFYVAAAAAWVIGCGIFLTATARPAKAGLLCTNEICNTAYDCVYRIGVNCALTENSCTGYLCD